MCLSKLKSWRQPARVGPHISKACRLSLVAVVGLQHHLGPHTHPGSDVLLAELLKCSRVAHEVIFQCNEKITIVWMVRQYCRVFKDWAQMWTLNSIQRSMLRLRRYAATEVSKMTKHWYCVKRRYRLPNIFSINRYNPEGMRQQVKLLAATA